MGKCSYCDNEMTDGLPCKEGIDESAILGDSGTCQDCGVPPGSCHHPGCDVERCGKCGGQAISCDCSVADYWNNREKVRWTGAWPGKLECAHFGFYCRDLDMSGGVVTMQEAISIQRLGGKVQWHVPCGKYDKGAQEDLNRWHDEGCPPIPADR